MAPDVSTLPRPRQRARERPERRAGDSLLDRIELLRVSAAQHLDPERQVELGQFLTPASVARLMASMFDIQGHSLRLLDAGAGIGSLTAAWVAEACGRARRPREVSVTAYEIEPLLTEQLRLTLQACASHCRQSGVQFHGEVRQEDFIGAGLAAAPGRLFRSATDPFDCAILNPPYRKLSADSRTRRLLASVGAEANLYSAFLSLTVALLRPGGELVAITPRSFCNGPYFRSFRWRFLDEMVLRRIHTFEARDTAFSEDEVLQENVILHVVKRPAKQGRVAISSSLGPEDDCPTLRTVDPSRVAKPGDPERVIHVPSDALSEAIDERMSCLPASLADLGLEVSTGRVVDFRAARFLRTEPGPDTAPLIYPSHMVDGFVHWPRNGGRKPNALKLAPETEQLLVPRGFYVVTRRFSSKEEPRRIVAAIYDPGRLPNCDVAFENHVNYFHAGGRPLDEDLAKGLAVFLNSTLVDCHFRGWSGHTQVNASDLRRLPYPSRSELEALGRSIDDSFPDQDELDRRIEEDLLAMTKLKKGPDPVRAKKRLQEARRILKDLGLPREQQNERSALTLLALVDLKPRTPWSQASSPLCGITPMLEFFAEHYGKVYAPNTRETVRRQTIHQFIQAGLAIPNPDKPTRPTNSPHAVYQIEERALALLRSYGTEEWDSRLTDYLATVGTLSVRYAEEREMRRIPLVLPTGAQITLSPGGQNLLVQRIIEEFCPRFTPGGKPVYVGDTKAKWAYFDQGALEEVGVAVEAHGKMPDVVVFHEGRRWLVLIEAVTGHGPMSPKRHHELKTLFKGAKAGLVFVTAFLTRRDLAKHLRDIAWETEVWIAENPTHMVHFDGERFLGPF
jgi:adenine-specific DNA-methyltransferase